MSGPASDLAGTGTASFPCQYRSVAQLGGLSVPSCRGAPAPVTICLASAIPPTPFQQEVLDLQSLLPVTCQGPLSGFGLAGYVDWLDADVSELLRDPSLPASLRWRLAEVRSFWQTRAWLLVDSRPDMPALAAMEAEAARLQAHPHAVAAPALPHFAPGPSHVRVHLTLRFLTYNVLTLRDPCATDSGVRPALGAAGMKFMGRRDVVKLQLLQQQVLFAGLQETRLADTATLPDADFHMLHAACTERGHFGLALWVSKRQAYGFFDGRPLTLELHHLTVVYHEPRVLAVRVQARFLDLLVAVLHVPHTACETDSAESL